MVNSLPLTLNGPRVPPKRPCDEVALCQHRGDPGGRKAEAGRKRQVEEKFERRCGAVRLVPTDGPRVMAPDANAGLHRPNTERSISYRQVQEPLPLSPWRALP